MPTDESESSLPMQTEPPAVLRSSPPSFSQPHSSKEALDDNQTPPVHSEPLDDAQKSPQQAQAFSEALNDSERPLSAQQVKRNGNSELPEVKDEEDKEDESSPADKIEDFNWDHLADRYHIAIRKCEQNEDELMQEWESLMNFFRVWADAGHSHETERTFSRLRTRMAHVQNSEQNLEKKRQHYINVVKAFERAIYLAYHVNPALRKDTRQTTGTFAQRRKLNDQFRQGRKMKLWPPLNQRELSCTIL